MVTKKHGHRCIGKTKLGKPCRAAATEGGLCYFHANPSKATELGRIGGKSKCPAAEGVLEIQALKTAGAVLDATEQLIRDVYSGKVRRDIADTVATLLNLQLRAIKTTEHEARLAALEKMWAESETKSGEDIDTELVMNPYG